MMKLKGRNRRLGYIHKPQATGYYCGEVGGVLAVQANSPKCPVHHLHSVRRMMADHSRASPQQKLRLGFCRVELKLPVPTREANSDRC
jgi:hypothetical protein